jgi:hypothetical protein
MNKHMDMAAAWGSSCKIIDSRHIAQSFKKDPGLFRDLELDIFFPSHASHEQQTRSHSVGSKALNGYGKRFIDKRLSSAAAAASTCLPFNRHHQQTIVLVDPTEAAAQKTILWTILKKLIFVCAR